MKRNNLRTFIYIFFLITGMNGLIFQVVWFKYLSLFLGNTTYAQTIVLATFLGGLAIGSFFFGKLADKILNQLKYYGVIELIIGIYGVVFPFIIEKVKILFFSVANESLIYQNPYVYLSIKLIFAAIVLIIPTTLMGGTLPLLTKFFTEKIDDIRKENANLYFLNSFGAVVGVFFAGFIFIKNFGLDTTILIAGLLNIFVGTLSLFLSIMGETYSENKFHQYNGFMQTTLQFELGPSNLKILILIAGLSGFASFMYEILWTRVLITIFGSSTYSFSIMLMAFISGITAGSFIVSSNFISRLNRLNVLFLAQSMISLTMLLALFILPLLPYYFWGIGSLFTKSNQTFSFFLTIEFLICFSLMFIPTLFMGMSLPLVVEIVAHQKKRVGYSVGTVFSVNTMGNVIGAISTGLILIPLIGIEYSFLLGISINLLASIIILSMTIGNLRKTFRITSFALPSMIIVLIFLTPEWNKNLMTAGIFRRISETPPQSYSDYRRFFNNREIIFYKDGISGNISVIKTLDTLKQKILLINGKPDASSYGDLPTQLLIGHIPMLLHPNPKDVFVVGFGSGSTVNATLKYNPDQVICSEISKEVIDASKYFEEVNESCINDNRLKLVIEDAQSYLKLTQKKFDVIISEPSNPWIAGIGNLFSKEYFERCKASLKPGGIMCQWFHIYEMDDDVLTMVLSTFNSVFPYVQTWGGVQGDLILIGSDSEMNPDFALISSKMMNQKILNNLKSIEIDNPFTLLTLQILSPEGTFTLTSEKKINSEKKPLLEFLAPVAFYKGQTTTRVYQNDEKFDTLNKKLFVKNYVKEYKPTTEEIINAIKFHKNRSGNVRFAYALSKTLVSQNIANNEILEILLSSESEMKIIKNNTQILQEAFHKHPDDYKIASSYANQIFLENVNATNFMKVFSIDSAEKIFLNFIKKENHLLSFKIYSQLASIFLKNSEPTKALNYCLKAEEILNKYPEISEEIDLAEFYHTFALSTFHLNEYGKVIEYFIKLSNYDINNSSKILLGKRIEWKVREEKKNQR